MKRIAAAVLSVLLLATVMAHADGNAVKAEAVFKALRHLPQHQAGESNKIGPNLHGLFDREAGKEAGFNYSMGLSTANFKWGDAKVRPSNNIRTPGMATAGRTAPLGFQPVQKKPTIQVSSTFIGGIRAHWCRG